MPWDKKRKIESREKVLAAAAELFSYYGYEEVSIDQVMKAAGLTRGAFYSHFQSLRRSFNYGC